MLPLWTFGRITSAWSAADAGVKVATAQVEVDRDAVRLDVRKAYFGLQLARDGLALLADARAQIERALGDGSKLDARRTRARGGRPPGRLPWRVR